MTVKLLICGRNLRLYVIVISRDVWHLLKLEGSVQNLDSGLWTGLMDWTVDWILD